MPISLVLDIIIAVLLVLTIAYAVRLNQRLAQLRSDKNELQKLAKTFAEATVRAEAGIQNLKVSSEALHAEVAKAEALKDDLAYLVERGGRTADEMVESVRAGKLAKSADAPLGQSPADAADARRTDPEAKLIEDAIRAATPFATRGTQGEAEGDDAVVTRRISGRLAGVRDAGKASSTFAPAGQLASRGLGARGRDMDDDIEDTQAARELLKALGSVK